MRMALRSSARSRPLRVLAGILLAAAALSPAWALPRYGAGGGGRWHDTDIRRFHEHDLDRWRAGAWRHGWRDGHVGWWWVVGDVWYFYPAPVYPYPDPYQPPMASTPPPDAPPAVYYFCDSLRGYYPYVPSCPTGWRVVPAQ